jgi:hypothetical protein
MFLLVNSEFRNNSFMLVNSSAKSHEILHFCARILCRFIDILAKTVSLLQAETAFSRLVGLWVSDFSGLKNV